MKKDNWITIFVTGIIGWLTVVGGGGLYFMAIDKLFLAYWLGVPLILFLIMLICVKYFSELEKEGALEALRSFINPLISFSDRQVANISHSLSHEYFNQKGSLNPHYDIIDLDIIGKRNLKWIKETVIEYNKLIEQMNKNISDYENEKTQDIKGVIIGQLEVAKGLAIGLNKELKKIQSKIIKKAGLGKEGRGIDD